MRKMTMGMLCYFCSFDGLKQKIMRQISETPLYYASFIGQVSVVEFLAFCGADVHKRTRSGYARILVI